jgi:glycosyltransferase involved in cell wall biosynthesis
MRVLFLTAQLQPFLCACLAELVASTDVQVLVYTQQSDPLGLLSSLDNRIRVVMYESRPHAGFRKSIEEFDPQMVWCAGWMYKEYLRWCRALKLRGVKCICAMDTQWKATPRQYALLTLARPLLHTAFSHAWVPGPRQHEYARRLGFKEADILKGLYAADVRLFAAAAARSTNLCSQMPFPKRFLFVGRFVPHKLSPLLLAFQRLTVGDLNGWRLELIGSGPLFDDPLMDHPAIFVRPAMSQQALANEAAKGGVFCLCSTDEPWGTVVQEFCAAGMPLVVSRQCGSSELYVRNNGILCDGSDPGNIARALLEMTLLSDEQLYAMAAESARLGRLPDVVAWVEALRSVEKR